MIEQVLVGRRGIGILVLSGLRGRGWERATAGKKKAGQLSLTGLSDSLVGRE
jgi:hypothetical protein